MTRMRSPLDTSTLVLAGAAVVLTTGGTKTCFSMLVLVLPQMVVALLPVGLMQVLVPQRGMLPE